MSSACVDYVPALCTHRPSLLPIEWSGELFGPWQRLWFAKLMLGEDTQTLSFRGRRSRNKVSVGEPAEGSLSFLHPHPCVLYSFSSFTVRAARPSVACTCVRRPSARRGSTLLRQTHRSCDFKSSPTPLASSALLGSFVISCVALVALTNQNTQLLSMDILA